MWFVLLVAAVALGGLLTIQVGANAHLRAFLGVPLSAALVNFAIGMVALALVAVGTRMPFPNTAAAGRAPWWAWSGGLIGATYVLSAVILAPRLGATLFFAALVAGQLVGAVVVDHFGWLGFPEQRVTVWRLAGVASLMLGVWLVRK